MKPSRLFALSCVALAAVSAGCDSRAVGRQGGSDSRAHPVMSAPEPEPEDVPVPQRGGRPVPCGLWRPADPGVEPDGYANVLDVEMEQVGVVGPPIAWARVRNIRTVVVPWLKGSNTVLEFDIDGIAPERAGDGFVIVDDRLVLYRVRPAKTPGSWRIDGVLDDDETLRVMRILGGQNECRAMEQT